MAAFQPTVEAFTSINFLWLKVNREKFPFFSQKQAFVLSEDATFEDIFPTENQQVISDWMVAFPKSVCLYIDSRLLSETQAQTFINGLEMLGIRYQEISEVLAEDPFIQSIDECIMQLETAVDVLPNIDIGFFIDYIKFELAYHQALIAEDEFCYVHSDFDYAPISQKEISELTFSSGFKTSWKKYQQPENEFFLLTDSHQRTHPNLLANMDKAYQDAVSRRLYLTLGTDRLFLEIYHGAIIDSCKSSNDSFISNKQAISITEKHISKHAATQNNFRTWR